MASACADVIQDVGTAPNFECPPNMNNPTPIDDPAHWRQRAEEARRMADQLADPEAKQAMLEIAASYEQLAKIAEARANR
jgi:hypothetical protein